MALISDLTKAALGPIGVSQLLPSTGISAQIGQGISGILNQLPGNNLWGSNRPITQALFGGSIASPVYAQEVQGVATPDPYAGAYSNNPFSGAYSTGGGGNTGTGNNGGGNQIVPNGTNLNNNSGQPSIPSYVDQLRGQIDSLYNHLSNGLDPQRAAQESIINNNFNQSLGDLNANQAQGNALLDTQARKTTEGQVRTLQDLADNIRNQMQAGNVYLGARGAGDSSAANQYSYALTQMGNKNRGNVLAQTNSIMGDIGDKRAQLQQVFTQESNRLGTERNNQLSSLAQWYADAQNQIGQLRGQAQISASQQVLNAALGALQQIDQQSQAKTAALQSWAVNNSKSLEGAIGNLNTISAYQAPNLTMQALNGTPNTNANNNFNVATGYGSNPNQKYDLFGNPIQ